MDSLLATYSSSDEEDEQTPQPPQSHPSSKPSISLFSSLPKPQSSSSSSSSISSSLPKPQSSSIFSSLPPPKSSSQTLKQEDSSSPTSSSIFSSLPPPKSSSQTLKQEDPISNSSSLFSSLPPPKSETTSDTPLPPPKPKRVVQFRPPIPQPSSNFDDDDEEEDEEDKRRKNQTQLVQDTSVKSFLSSMPTPKSSGQTSLGALPSSLGSGRRSIIETEAPISSSDVNRVNDDLGYGANAGNEQENLVGVSNYSNYEVGGVAGDQGYASYGGNSSDYGGSVSSNWSNNASSHGEMAATPSIGVESFARLGGKRRKDQPPSEIIEVKQDELMKNRPTEDKSKLTGIAFGPAYQPASTKGKPSKLHKRKHQIGSLYFDMKQKEMELSERRARGLLTKAETQAKYGW
ncbi:Proline-rich protein PRCC [Bienertia sinuspersici]